jgi:hypothetical protein
LVPCVLGAGTLAALALSVSRRRLMRALILGVVVTLMTFIGTYFITGARWEG